MNEAASNMYMPYVTEDSPRGRETRDIFSRLLKDRKITIDLSDSAKKWLGRDMGNLPD